MKREKKGYLIRKRKDCNRWELFIYDKNFGQLYAGLYKSEEEAKESLKKNWSF